MAQVILSVGLSIVDVNATAWLAKEALNRTASHKNTLDYYSHLENEVQSIGGLLSSLLFCVLCFSVDGRSFFYEKIYTLAAVSVLFLAGYIKKIPETIHVKQRDTTLPSFYVGAHHFLVVIKSPYHFIFITLSSLIWCAYQPLFHFWQPLLASKDFSSISFIPNTLNTILGLSFVSLNVEVFIFNKAMTYVSPSNRGYCLIGAFFSGVSIGLFYILGPGSADILRAILAFSILHGCLSVLWKIVRNKCLKNSNKQDYGKLLALSGMSCRLSSLVFLLTISFILKYAPLSDLFGWCAGLSAVMSALFLLWGGFPTNRAQNQRLSSQTP